MPYLRVKTGPSKGKVFEIASEIITIGRDESQTIQVFDQGVSRKHAEIFRIGKMLFVRDLESTNGTFVNNEKISEEPLKSGDEVLIGTTVLSVEEGNTADGSADEVELMEDSQPIASTTVELRVNVPKGVQEEAPARQVESRNLSVVYEVGKILHDARDVNDALSKTLEILGKTINADLGYALFVDRKSGKLVRKSGYNPQGGLEE
jgi:pSer/pThr/pTyr-binding forkhead associated (FHA) protein